MDLLFKIKNLSKKKLFALFSILIIIISLFIFVTFQISVQSSELIASIHVDKVRIRINEQILFSSANSSGDIVGYHWDFGDGNTSDETNPPYRYEVSGWFNVSLIISDDTNRNASAFINIGVQFNDGSINEGRGQAIVIGPNRRNTMTVGFQVGPNIGNPTIEINAVVTQPVGGLQFRIRCRWSDPTNGPTSMDLFTDNRIGTGTDILFYYTVNPDDIPDDARDYYSSVIFYYTLENGRDGGVEIEASISFPLN